MLQGLAEDRKMCNEEIEGERARREAEVIERGSGEKWNMSQEKLKWREG